MKKLKIICKENKDGKKIDADIDSEGFTFIEVVGMLEDLKTKLIIDNKNKSSK